MSKKHKDEWKHLPHGIKYCPECGTYATSTTLMMEGLEIGGLEKEVWQDKPPINDKNKEVQSK